MRGLEPWMSLLEIQKKMPVELQGSWQDPKKKKGGRKSEIKAKTLIFTCLNDHFTISAFIHNLAINGNEYLRYSASMQQLLMI